MFNLRKVLL